MVRRWSQRRLSTVLLFANGAITLIIPMLVPLTAITGPAGSPVVSLSAQGLGTAGAGVMDGVATTAAAGVIAADTDTAIGAGTDTAELPLDIGAASPLGPLLVAATAADTLAGAMSLADSVAAALVVGSMEAVVDSTPVAVDTGKA